MVLLLQHLNLLILLPQLHFLHVHSSLHLPHAYDQLLHLHLQRLVLPPQLLHLLLQDRLIFLALPHHSITLQLHHLVALQFALQFQHALLQLDLLVEQLLNLLHTVAQHQLQLLLLQCHQLQFLAVPLLTGVGLLAEVGLCI